MLLDLRPLQCFRCLESGHARDQCKNDIDRSKRCYRCGKEGHKAQECEDTPRCPVCGLGEANHRAGNKACTSARIRRRVGPSPKPTKMTVQETSTVVETTINREEINTVEMTDITEQPKPQRVRSRLPRPKEIELVDRPVVEMLPQQQQQEEISQDIRDRAQRAAKAQKFNRKATRRHADSEDEERTCEPEDSKQRERNNGCYYIAEQFKPRLPGAELVSAFLGRMWWGCWHDH